METRRRGGSATGISSAPIKRACFVSSVDKIVILKADAIWAADISSNLFLSPLAGYTNLPFRLVVREIGGVGLCTTDLVNARSLLEKNPKAFRSEEHTSE